MYSLKNMIIHVGVTHVFPLVAILFSFHYHLRMNLLYFKNLLDKKKRFETQISNILVNTSCINISFQERRKKIYIYFLNNSSHGLERVSPYVSFPRIIPPESLLFNLYRVRGSKIYRKATLEGAIDHARDIT